MNCVKCPIIEECEVVKMPIQSTFAAGLNIPTAASPVEFDACPLLILVKESKNQNLKN